MLPSFNVYSYSWLAVICVGPVIVFVATVDSTPFTNTFILLASNVLGTPKYLSFTLNFTVPVLMSTLVFVHTGSTTSTFSGVCALSLS